MSDIFLKLQQRNILYTWQERETNWTAIILGAARD